MPAGRKEEETTAGEAIVAAGRTAGLTETGARATPRSWREDAEHWKLSKNNYTS